MIFLILSNNNNNKETIATLPEAIASYNPNKSPIRTQKKNKSGVLFFQPFNNGLVCPITSSSVSPLR